MAVISQGVILSSLGSDFDNFVTLPAAGSAGGVLVAWRHHIGFSGVHRVDSFSVSVQLHPSDDQAWWLTCVYGPQTNEDKLVFLQELRTIRDEC
ncbi:hypothetical protein U9M48_037532 [Paspalum notatum var. saurae]|uniref:Uncharacterized protein n=1 Tax=Paspalum notatum var. saurae TaxID=547442 RepID=A0AAQ3ULE5_PASNO